jgi:recombination protein RecR
VAAGLPPLLRQLVQAFTRLPGVGEKTALRYTMYLLADQKPAMEILSQALAEACDKLRACDNCGNIAEIDASGAAVCAICSDSRRDQRQLCVVGKVQDLMAVERSGAMRGRYFVLGRLLSPLDGIGPEELPLPGLLGRIKRDGVREVIIATPPSVDGEATALLLARELGPTGAKVSRIASGVPHGGDLEFADQITLGRAIDGRRSLDPR